MIDLEHDGDLPKDWWKKYHKDIEKAKKNASGKLNWTPWGHANELRKPENHSFVRRLYHKGRVSKAFLKELGINPVF